MSTTLDLQLASGREILPGYVLQERIGSGGCGEVWRAQAPGNLAKAIKIVFGALDEDRAARELKSLERIKELNHPFLLSIERIEVVDGRLLIVSELAEGSLSSRFEHHRQQGNCGIPREELIRHVEETADVLDYIAENRGLQHLDIKPENILVVGGHAKLADFGLLKDVREASQSLIHGLTPAYASPEVFDGRPGPRSDQYSLGVVYQHMATGTPPFNGDTAAKLATQHLHCQPELNDLTPQERFAVGKALSKDPGRRFRSCREFVNRLKPRSRTSVSVVDSVLDSMQLQDGASSTGVGSLPGDGPHDGKTVAISSPRVESLSPISTNSDEAIYRPALFLGLGGTAGRVLRSLKRKLGERLCDSEQLRALQFLMIDTDVAAVNEATDPAQDGALRDDEALLLPLKRSWDYKSGKISTLPSLSRRWLYNVPRSMKTEGIRAVGRIALLDHAQRVLDRLRTAILELTDNQTISETAERSGLPFQHTDPRVFVVSSLAGGTGSGMLIDVGYAVRQLLAEVGLSDEEVCNVLTYSTAANDTRGGIGAANAYSCLQELEHFALPANHYPGERQCRLLPFAEEGPTFPHNYLIDFGDGLDEPAFQKRVDEVANYLLLNSVSPAVAFFDRCRQTDDDHNSSGELSLRTFGISGLDTDAPELPAEWSHLLSACVVRKWRGKLDASVDASLSLSPLERKLNAIEDANFSGEEAANYADKLAATLGLSFRDMVKLIVRTLDTDLGCRPDSFLMDVGVKHYTTRLARDEAWDEVLACSLQQIRVIARGEGHDATTDFTNQQTIFDRLAMTTQKYGDAFGTELSKQVLTQINRPSMRLKGARSMLERFASLLDGVYTEAKSQLERVEQGIQQFELTTREHIAASQKRNIVLSDEAVFSLIQQSAALQSQLLILEGVCKTLAYLKTNATRCSDQLRDLWKDLNRLFERFNLPDDGPASQLDASAQAGELVSLEAVFSANWKEMVLQLDEQLNQTFFGEPRDLVTVLTKGGGMWDELVATMLSTARKVIYQYSQQSAVSVLQAWIHDGKDKELAGVLRRASQAASPMALANGGQRRLFMIGPQQAQPEMLNRTAEDVIGDPPSNVRDDDSPISLGYEATQLPVKGVFIRFIRSRSDCEELARNLHTRIDVDW